MPDDGAPLLDPLKFHDFHVTAKGEPRAFVELAELKTLWLNTGSLCNIACTNCYMDSGPKKDDLAYLSAAEAARFFDEIAADGWTTTEIGLTGGEPFMNDDVISILGDALGRGHTALVLTNAMKPLWQKRAGLLELLEDYGDRLTLRVSVDHFTQALHDTERGAGSWDIMRKGLDWLIAHGFGVDVAGRTLWHENEAQSRRGYQQLFDAIGLSLDAANPAHLVLFPEMDESRDVPEITTACWGLLDVRPDAQMCATSRMVVRRKGADTARVVPCTLLPYDPAFDMGETLSEAQVRVMLNHPHCAKFCVLGGASCSA